VSDAAGTLDQTPLPIPGEAARQAAAALAAKNATASPVDLANALILAYCRRVTADQSVDPATRRAWLLDFGAQVTTALQQRAVADR
jgi:hypothetical protein